MHILVATSLLQGERPTDFHHGIEGELVRLGEICRKDRSDPDGGCGCGRSFAGIVSQRATTTARVADLAFSREQYADAWIDGMRTAGWDPCPCCEVDAVDELVEIAANWPEGTVVERRLMTVAVRALPEEMAITPPDGP